MDEMSIERVLRGAGGGGPDLSAATFHHSRFLQASITLGGTNGSSCPYLGNMFPTPAPFRSPSAPLANMRPFWAPTTDSYSRYGMPPGLYPIYPSLTPSPTDNSCITRLTSLPSHFPNLLNSYKDPAYYSSPFTVPSPLVTSASRPAFSPQLAPNPLDDQDVTKAAEGSPKPRRNSGSCWKAVAESQAKKAAAADKSKELGKLKSKLSEKTPQPVISGVKKCSQCDVPCDSAKVLPVSKAFSHQIANLAKSTAAPPLSSASTPATVSHLANAPCNVTSSMPLRVCVTTPALRASPILSPSQHPTTTTTTSTFTIASLTVDSQPRHTRCSMVAPYTSSTTRILAKCHSTKHSSKKKDQRPTTPVEAAKDSSTSQQKSDDLQALNLSISADKKAPVAEVVTKPAISRTETIGVCYPTTKTTQTKQVPRQVAPKPLVPPTPTKSSLGPSDKPPRKGTGDSQPSIPIGIAIAHQRQQDTAKPPKSLEIATCPENANAPCIETTHVERDLKRLEKESHLPLVTPGDVTEAPPTTWLDPFTRGGPPAPPQPWVAPAPVLAGPTLWVNPQGSAEPLQLARDPTTGSLFLIPATAATAASSLEVAEPTPGGLWPAFLSVPNSAPIQHLINQPQIVSQIVNQEHITGSTISFQQQVQESAEKSSQDPSAIESAATGDEPTGLPPAQPFTYATFPASAAPTISYFFESSSVVQLPPSSGADMGKRSQGTSPLHPCNSPPPALEDNSLAPEEEDESDGGTQVKANTCQVVSTATQVDMSSDEDSEERPLDHSDSGNQTDEIARGGDQVPETPANKSSSTKGETYEMEVDNAPVLSAESKPVMDFIDYHGLNLLVDSIEEFSSREQVVAPPKPPELDTSGCTDGLGLLCALAEQRFQEEKLASQTLSPPSPTEPQFKLSITQLQKKYKQRKLYLQKCQRRKPAAFAACHRRFKRNHAKSHKAKELSNEAPPLLEPSVPNTLPRLTKEETKETHRPIPSSAFVQSTAKIESKSAANGPLQPRKMRSKSADDKPSSKLRSKVRDDTKSSTDFSEDKNKPLVVDKLWFIRRSERIFLHDAGVVSSNSDALPPLTTKISKTNNKTEAKAIKIHSDPKIRHKTPGRKPKLLENQVKKQKDEDGSGGESSSEDVPLSELVPKVSVPELRSCRLTPQDLHDKIRVILMEDDLFYAGYVTAIRAPDVYGVVLDGERASRPHIFSREEILNEALAEVKPQCPRQLTEGARLCAYWSQQYRCLYPGTVARSPEPVGPKLLVYVEFDDGDSGRIPMEDIRMLPLGYPILGGGDSQISSKNEGKKDSTESLSSTVGVVPVAALEDRPPKRKKHKHHKEDHKHHHHHHHHHHHRKKHKSTTSSCSMSDSPSYTCVLSPESETRKLELTVKIKTSDLPVASPTEDEDDEAFVAATSPPKKKKQRQCSAEKSKIAAFLPINQLWRWHGTCLRRRAGKGKAKKDLYKTIVRGKEILNVGDCAVFLSTGRPHLPYVGRIVRLWQSWGGNMMVRVKWFYHPEETRKSKKIVNVKGALFESPHMDENDVQTISHKCEVLPWADYKERVKEDDDVYYLAGQYDPISGNMQLEPGVT